MDHRQYNGSPFDLTCLRNWTLLPPPPPQRTVNSSSAFLRTDSLLSSFTAKWSQRTFQLWTKFAQNHSFQNPLLSFYCFSGDQPFRRTYSDLVPQDCTSQQQQKTPENLVLTTSLVQYKHSSSCSQWESFLAIFSWRVQLALVLSSQQQYVHYYRLPQISTWLYFMSKQWLPMQRISSNAKKTASQLYTFNIRTCTPTAQTCEVVRRNAKQSFSPSFKSYVALPLCFSSHVKLNHRISFLVHAVSPTNPPNRVKRLGFKLRSQQQLRSLSRRVNSTGVVMYTNVLFLLPERFVLCFCFIFSFREPSALNCAFFAWVMLASVFWWTRSGVTELRSIPISWWYALASTPGSGVWQGV